MRYDLQNLFLACYDNDGGTDGGAGAGGNDAGGSAAGKSGGNDGGAGGGGDVKNQAELNSALKREKEKYRQRDEQRAKELEDMKNTLRLTEEQKATFESQIEELRTAHLSAEEKAKRTEERLNKEWQTKHAAAEQVSQHWQNKFTAHKIGHDITAASVQHQVIPANVKFVEAFLGPRTRLVEVQDDDGKGTGDYTAMVKFPDHTKEGKPFTADLTVPEAIKRMKELPEEYGYLFQAPGGGGLGGQSGVPGKKRDASKMSTAEWMEARKKDRGALLRSVDGK